jgi:cytochrome c nitrite reductase small subunit
MGPPAKSKVIWRLVVVLVLVGGAVGGFVSFGPPGLYAKSAEPDFCASCHVMESEYEAWFHSSHRTFKCVECHLPNDNFVNHGMMKSIEGMRDMFLFYSGQVPERIELSQNGAQMVVANCKRCHAEMISRINEERNCWSCHRRLSHRTTGAM